ncbi:hypothetical protein D3C72_1429200 [compost metagenome]
MTLKLTAVIYTVAFPVNRFENNAHIGGANNGPPVMAPILRVNSTIPPISGTISATIIIKNPKNQDDARAINISFFSEACGFKVPL